MAAASLQKPDIFAALRSLTEKTVLRRQDLGGAGRQFSAYAPINQYLLMLGQQTKPETASEYLYRALIEDTVGAVTFPQVNIGVGYVDFILPETGSTPVLLELKPLFTRYDAEEFRSHKLSPRTHLDQVKKYLCKHEYVILTDLRDAYLYSARDTFVEDTFFCELPFAELLERHAQSRNLYDVLRRAEDEIEKPELDRVFFEDLQQWITEFEPVRFLQAERAGELVILLINKLIFAKTLEDYGLIPFRFLQDRYDSEKTDWEAKGPTAYVRTFLRRTEEWLDEHYDTELFEERIWEQLDKSPANLDRFSRKLDLLLGVAKWDQVFHRGIVHYNYRRINEDIFGKSYEMFLAANRKDEGIYYTPAPITTPMANSLVEALFAPLVDQIVALLGPRPGMTSRRRSHSCGSFAKSASWIWPAAAAGSRSRSSALFGSNTAASATPAVGPAGSSGPPGTLRSAARDSPCRGLPPAPPLAAAAAPRAGRRHSPAPHLVRG